MKKLGLALTIATLSTYSAQAAPTIYGKAFVTTDYVDTIADYDDDQRISSPKYSTNNTLQINSHFSRLGVKGSEAMTANTEVIYRLEYGIQIDGNEGAAFSSRDTYFGFTNKIWASCALVVTPQCWVILMTSCTTELTGIIWAVLSLTPIKQYRR